MNRRLLVIVSEAVSEWIEKGEVVDRYYNPGERFSDVDLLLTNDDAPDPEALERLVGSARVTVHNLPVTRKLFVATLGWRTTPLREWAGGAVTIARRVKPDLVRCHGAHLNGICALEVRRALAVPVVVSLHTLPGDTANPAPPRLWEHLEEHAARRVRLEVIRNADVVLAVYSSLIPYLESVGARRVELAYNVLNGAALRTKEEYSLHDPVRVVSVGRQIPGKDPSDIVRAVAARPGIRLTLVGDGSLHNAVRATVDELGVAGRVELAPAVPNDELVQSLPDYDVFAAQNEYRGIPKAILEAMLAGLPILVNETDVPELSTKVCLQVDRSTEGYGAGLDRLVSDEALREQLGRAARAWADATCAPEVAEARVAALYDELLERAKTN